MFGSLQGMVYTALAVAVFIVELWALIDALRRPAGAFDAAGKRTKAFWTVILGAAAAVGFLGLPAPFGVGFSSPLGLVGIAAVIAAGIYLADVRPAVRGHGGGRGQRRPERGGW